MTLRNTWKNQVIKSFLSSCANIFRSDFISDRSYFVKLLESFLCIIKFVVVLNYISAGSLFNCVCSSTILSILNSRTESTHQFFNLTLGGVSIIGRSFPDLKVKVDRLSE